MEGIFTFLKRLSRRKAAQLDHSELNRVLGTLDLTFLGVGSTIGVGIYVLAGQVSRDTSGPAVTISFLIAAIASLFAGLCYAEFGGRVPRAGSAYIYTYVCIGEFVAFIIGWNLILEYVIGTASVARGFSLYIDALANETIKKTLQEVMPIESSFLSSYPDFLSFGLAFLLSIGLAVGVKESSRVNNIFTCINLIVIIFVIIAAGSEADVFNWSIPTYKVNETCSRNYTFPEEKMPEDLGVGGFAPYGFQGIMSGAATCFFGFVGFDVIATTGEEAMNPSRTIPLAIGLSLLIVFLSYFGISAVITLVVPYCLQDEDAPLVAIFDTQFLNWPAAKWFVSIGALFGFSASLFGALFPMPRVLYAMASDGLLFRTLSNVSKRFHTPTFATLISGLFAGGMALLFDLDALVDMMSIGTLLAYTIVAICVLLLRYTDIEVCAEKSEYTLLTAKYADEEEDEESGGVAKSTSDYSQYAASDYLKQLFNTKSLTRPTTLTASLTVIVTLIFCVMALLLGALLVALSGPLGRADGGAIAAITIIAIITIIIVFAISRQPESKKQLSFKVPLVPWIPAFSAFTNLYLMCNLKYDTWIRFGVWMAIGLINYFGYSISNSSEEYRMQGKKPPHSIHFVENIGTIFDSDSEEEILYSQYNSD